MKQEIKYLIIVGTAVASVVSWAHFNFASSSRVEKIESRSEQLVTKGDLKEFKEDMKELFMLHLNKR